MGDRRTGRVKGAATATLKIANPPTNPIRRKSKRFDGSVASPIQLVVGVIAVGGVVHVALAALAYRNRSVPAARPYGWLSLAAGLWALFQVGLVVASPSVAGRLYGVMKLVSYQIPVLWLAFAATYAGRGDWLTRRRTVALSSPLTAYVLVRYFLPVGSPFRAALESVTVAGVTAPVPEVTAGLVVATVLGYVYVLTGFAVLLQFYADPGNFYPKQTGVVVLAALLPFLGDVAFTAGYAVHPALSLAPALLTVYGVVVAAALFKWEGHTITASVGDVLVDELREPVLVLDGEDTVVSHNDAATRLVDGSGLVGLHADDVVAGLADEREGTITAEGTGTDRDGLSSVYDLRTADVEDQFGDARGRVVLMRDVSDEQRRLDQLEAMQAASRRFIGARTEPEVASVAVDFATEALDQPYVVLLVADEETDSLVSVATSDAVAAETGAGLTVTPGDGVVWDAYERGETRAITGGRDLVVGTRRLPVSSALVLPLGEHGVLVVGHGDRDYSAVERQFGGILARTVETALTRVSHERELRQNRAALERRTRQIEFFNGVLRHNIRNSMTVIHGQAEALAGEVDDRDRVETIQEWCDDLTELTETVREINQTVVATECERLEAVDLPAVVDDEVAAARQRYDCEISADVDPDTVVAANHLVGDVLDGLLANAVEHNDRETPQVRITSRDVGEWVQVRIADDGPGLPAELKDRVFQRELTASHTAHGFGLYFVSVMMDLYDGNVWFEDNDPRGTVVVLEFRRHEALESARTD